MPLETDPAMLEGSTTLLRWLGATSLLGALGLYVAWITLPPELVIEAVVDKSKKFNSESRIKIKNNGKMPALAIKADVENLCAVIATNRFENCGIFNGPSAVARLAGGESAEISISPGVGFGQGMQITEFSYTLILKHQAKVFFFHKKFQKRWKVELRNFADGFAWHVVPA
jgi:hypothetical protein